MKFKESALAHKLLDGLAGLEIGGSAHNSFGLKTRNVDYTAELTCFKPGGDQAVRRSSSGGHCVAG